MAALLTLDVARNWDRAGTLADRVARQAAELAPFEGSLLVVTVPDSYRSARVFTNSFDLAVANVGADFSRISWCIPVNVRDAEPGTITVEEGQGEFLARTGWEAPFDFPVLRDPSPLVPGCSYAATDSGETAPGQRLTAIATPEGTFRQARIAYFDGHDLRLLRAK